MKITGWWGRGRDRFFLSFRESLIALRRTETRLKISSQLSCNLKGLVGVVGEVGLVTKSVWVIDQVWGQDGWILFMIRHGVQLRFINSQKKERGQYPAILIEQAWSIKALLYGFWGNLSCGTRRVIQSGQDSSILPARAANHSPGFSSCSSSKLHSLPLRLFVVKLSFSINRRFVQALQPSSNAYIVHSECSLQAKFNFNFMYYDIHHYIIL